MSRILVLSALIFGAFFPGFAHAQTSKADQIGQLLHQIRTQTKITGVDDNTLDQVIEKLQEAQDILAGNGPNSLGACLQFTTDAYRSVYGDTSMTTDLATQDCQSIHDLQVTRFLYNQLVKVYGKSVLSIGVAVSDSKGLNGKEALLEFIYGAYVSSYGDSDLSVTLAVAQAAKLNRRSLSCMQAQYANYKNLDGAGSLSIEMAVTNCAQSNN